jgi:predicted short-subunit dehydrogenase-like oxidoreductase (DUF2520 family)
MKIVLLGSGNVATCLGRLCLFANYEVLQVFGRTPASVEELAKEMNAEPVTEWSAISKDADFYIAALSDGALAAFADNLQLEKGIIVHTAGAVSMEVLSGVSKNYGVLYPLQSLRKEIVHYHHIPLLVDGNTPDNKTIIANFAASLSGKTGFANDADRLRLHLAAVLVSNFTNHLFTIANDFCLQEKIDFNLLLPLMEHTVSRLHSFPPNQIQTGPAVRNDLTSIQNHLDLLKDYPNIAHLYQVMTQSIQAYAGFTTS